jgi:hypothetical protein
MPTSSAVFILTKLITILRNDTIFRKKSRKLSQAGVFFNAQNGYVALCLGITSKNGGKGKALLPKDSKNGKTLLWLCLVAIARNIMHIKVFTLAWTM